MGLKECASWISVCRGYDYYKQNKVLEIKQESETTFSSLVEGSGGVKYHVCIDIKHPRRSKCDCPHAKDRRIVCKHQMATFFKAFPEEVKKLEREFVLAEQYEEELENKKEVALENYLNSLSKEELKLAIYDLLNICPGWVRDNFYVNNVEFNEDDFYDEIDEEFDDVIEESIREARLSERVKEFEKPINCFILKMRLRDTDIWRKIEVNCMYSFADLHSIIQIVFGWDDRHIHQFEIGSMVIGNYEDAEVDLDDCASAFKFEDDVKLELILLNYKGFVYHYDFGDDWYVDIEVEKVATTRIHESPKVLEFGGCMAKEDCGGAEALMKTRKRKTNIYELNLILEMTFEV